MTVYTPCPALLYGILMTACPPMLCTQSGISSLLTSRMVSGVRMLRPDRLLLSSLLKNSYALSAIILLRPPARQAMTGFSSSVRLRMGIRCQGFCVT